MSDIPDDIMKAAAELDRACDYMQGGQRRCVLARALMAADEAATKRERERIQAIIKAAKEQSEKYVELSGEHQWGDGYCSALDEIAGILTILKGDA